MTFVHHSGPDPDSTIFIPLTTSRRQLERDPSQFAAELRGLLYKLDPHHRWDFIPIYSSPAEQQFARALAPGANWNKPQTEHRPSSP